MRRPVIAVVAVLAQLCLWGVPGAQANRAGGCVISGEIQFTPTSESAGVWSIDPAVITCAGTYRGVRRITGPGAFHGDGTYRALADGTGSCLRQLGTGSVDYVIPTQEANLQFREKGDFVLAGAGVFSTPSIRAPFQLGPPFEGDCATHPVTRATFVAEASMVGLTA
ncbi:MAG TPA: hypothetical protein VHL53_12660 [Acidimicrobiia bacterium]|nr:hypothetical protein [Acidimicrobiia bacterium]